MSDPKHFVLPSSDGHVREGKPFQCHICEGWNCGWEHYKLEVGLIVICKSCGGHLVLPSLSTDISSKSVDPPDLNWE